MLYPKNKAPCLDPALFKNPTSEYRGTPFWAWNGKLSKDELGRQIDGFQQMGLGGFHMHVRTGLDTEYLSDEYMDYIKFCIEKAREKGMLAWMYDEDRWPSGTAGGMVTRDKPENARKSLLLTTEPYAPDRPYKATRPEPGRGQESMRQDNGELLAVYDICLHADGTLRSSKRIGIEDAVEGVKWYAYMEHATADPWFNDTAYVDTLHPQAIRDFLSSTHEVYAKHTGKDFGGIVPAMFTDEPQFTPKENLRFADEQKNVFMPWTIGLETLYLQRYGEDLLDVIPELLWELPEGKLSSVRWKFQNLLTDRFVDSYCKQIGDWCQNHNLALTGHVMGESSLEDQTQAVGDAMRCYRHFGIPGIDMLCDFHEYTTAKQTQSIVRQAGKEGMLSELYGVTGWDYDFRGYKLQGDWQAALGVTVRVPHLAWMTMKGEAKRDYPAAINYQSPWWDQFSMIEDHFSRLNTALTRGKAQVRVAVVHPIESYWLHWGPADQTAAIRAQLQQQFGGLCETLLFGGIDFDYICEAELPDLCPVGGNPLQVGKMAYDAIIVPQLTTIRDTTLKRLQAFSAQGGALFFIGECPSYVNAEPSNDAETLYKQASHLQDSASEILRALEPFRFVDIRRMDGRREDRLLHQLRRDGDDLWLFLCNGKNPTCPDVDDAGRLRFIFKGEYTLTHYDTMSGEIFPLTAQYRNGMTILERDWFIHESMLLRLTPGCGLSGAGVTTEPGIPDIRFGSVDVTLEEPNMLLLDMAEYSWNDSDFYAEDELLRIDNYVRQILDIPVRRKEVVQPYRIAPETAKDTLTLRFRIPSEVPVSGIKLAMEDAEQTAISLNGVSVPAVTDGWFVDRAIHTVPLPDLVVGENILLVTVPIGKRTHLEYFYLLGDFGVRVCGTIKTVTAPVRTLGFGDIVPQGLPFYTGNLRYRFTIESDSDHFVLRVPRYRGGLLKVFVDGIDHGNIAFSPYIKEISCIPGRHEVEIRLYGTRQNGFAQLHHTPGVYFYQSPNSWRSADDLWCYEYQFKPAGILTSPEVYGAAMVQSDGTIRKTAGHTKHITDRS